MADVKDWEATIQFANPNRTGEQPTKCPWCQDTRTKSDSRSKKPLSVNLGRGKAKCNHCGIVAHKPDMNAQQPKRHEPIKEVPQDDGSSLNAYWIDFLEKRKISLEAAQALGWTTHKGNLCFNFIEGGKIVHRKWRMSQGKDFRQDSGNTRKVFYNIDATKDTEEVWIVEGEMDVAALYTVGITNVISLPSATSLSGDWWENTWPYLKDKKHFIIGVDMDAPGLQAREELAHRLGRWRCSYVEWEGKDANDDLISGVLEKTAKNQIRFQSKNFTSFRDAVEDAYDVFLNGYPDVLRPKGECFGNLRENIGMILGQVTTVTGIPQHGKSEFVEWLVLNLCRDHNLNAAFYTPEHEPFRYYVPRLIQKIVGAPMSKQEAIQRQVRPMDLESFIAARDQWDNKIHLRASNGFPNWDELLESFEESVAMHNSKIFIVDAFNKVAMPSGGDSQLKNIAEALGKVIAFARKHQVLIFLIAHPKKVEELKIPSMYDISGSADFFNMSDNGFTVWRDRDQDSPTYGTTKIAVTKLKHSFQGSAGGTYPFQFNMGSHRYYTSGRPDNSDWTKDISEKRSSNTSEPRTQQEDVVPF